MKVDISLDRFIELYTNETRIDNDLERLSSQGSSLAFVNLEQMKLNMYVRRHAFNDLIQALFPSDFIENTLFPISIAVEQELKAEYKEKDERASRIERDVEGDGRDVGASEEDA